MMISKETAIDIATAHREIKTATELLEKIQGVLDNFKQEDIRDSFGRRQDGLQLGVPSGGSSTRLFNVDWKLAKPVIEAHIAKVRAELKALNEKARLELSE